MARVRSFLPGSQSVDVHPSEVDCFHQVISTASGERLLHLSTFGSDDRASVPKSSQSMQLSQDRARDLLRILLDTFPAIRSDASPTKESLKDWVVEALRRLGGSARVADVCREIWHMHASELVGSGDLEFTWQYDVRWAAQQLRDEGLLRPASDQAGREWELA